MYDCIVRQNVFTRDVPDFGPSSGMESGSFKEIWANLSLANFLARFARYASAAKN